MPLLPRVHCGRALVCSGFDSLVPVCIPSWHPSTCRLGRCASLHTLRFITSAMYSLKGFDKHMVTITQSGFTP